MIEYRKAGMSDVDELVQMRIEFLNEVQHPESDSVAEALNASLKDYFVENMNADRFAAYVATDDGHIAGTSGICFYSLPPSYKNLNGKVAYIMNMYTKPAYRGRGIAPTLFEKVVAEAKERGCTKISLHATEMGRPIYLKFGFKETSDEMVLRLP